MALLSWVSIDLSFGFDDVGPITSTDQTILLLVPEMSKDLALNRFTQWKWQTISIGARLEFYFLTRCLLASHSTRAVSRVVSSRQGWC